MVLSHVVPELVSRLAQEDMPSAGRFSGICGGTSVWYLAGGQDMVIVEDHSSDN